MALFACCFVLPPRIRKSAAAAADLLPPVRGALLAQLARERGDLEDSLREEDAGDHHVPAEEHFVVGLIEMMGGSSLL